MSGPKCRAIAMGGSAGAIQVLNQILPALPAGFDLPVFIVVHIPSETPSALPALFQARCALEVKEAEDKENIRPGVVYFAPPNYHLLIEMDGTLSLSSDEPELFSRPAINVLFESAADAYGPELAGVVLTGASEDGAAGLRAVCAKGGIGLVQDPRTAEAAIMPEAALKACPSARALDPGAMAALLKKLGGAG